MQTTDKAKQRSQIDALQGLIIIEKSPRGRRLKQPITVEIPENFSQEVWSHLIPSRLGIDKQRLPPHTCIDDFPRLPV